MDNDGNNNNNNSPQKIPRPRMLLQLVCFNTGKNGEKNTLTLPKRAKRLPQPWAIYVPTQGWATTVPLPLGFGCLVWILLIG